MKVKRKNLVLYLIAMLFVAGAIGAALTPKVEYVYPNAPLAYGKYEVVTYPYTGLAAPFGIIAAILVMIALFVEFENEKQNESDKERKRLEKRKILEKEEIERLGLRCRACVKFRKLECPRGEKNGNAELCDEYVLLQEEKKESEDDMTLREWIEDEKSAT